MKLVSNHSCFFLVPPSVMPEPSSGKVVVRKDTTVTLECKANGNPSPSVTWTKRSFSSQLHNNNNNNKNVEDEERRNVEHSQGRSVKIKRINKQGKGAYRHTLCSAIWWLGQLLLHVVIFCVLIETFLSTRHRVPYRV